MSVESHLAELERQHQALEREIEEAMAHPGVDDLEITELKRRKLRIKDEMERLKKDETLH
jgi:hypothetical protein